MRVATVFLVAAICVVLQGCEGCGDDDDKKKETKKKKEDDDDDDDDDTSGGGNNKTPNKDKNNKNQKPQESGTKGVEVKGGKKEGGDGKSQKTTESKNEGNKTSKESEKNGNDANKSSQQTNQSSAYASSKGNYASYGSSGYSDPYQMSDRQLRNCACNIVDNWQRDIDYVSRHDVDTFRDIVNELEGHLYEEVDLTWRELQDLVADHQDLVRRGRGGYGGRDSGNNVLDFFVGGYDHVHRQCQKLTDPQTRYRAYDDVHHSSGIDKEKNYRVLWAIDNIQEGCYALKNEGVRLDRIRDLREKVWGLYFYRNNYVDKLTKDKAQKLVLSLAAASKEVLELLNREVGTKSRKELVSVRDVIDQANKDAGVLNSKFGVNGRSDEEVAGSALNQHDYDRLSAALDAAQRYMKMK